MTGTRLRRIGDVEQLIFDELLRAVGDVEFDRAYPPDGEFFVRSDGVREYWYHRGRNSDPRVSDSGNRTRYVGPCGDPEIEVRIGREMRDNADLSRLRDHADSLCRMGWTSATNIEGRVLRALATAGAFRLRSVLVGSVAYQAYSGLLGVRLPSASVRTDDVDIATDFGISNSLDDTCDDILQALRQVDPSFTPKPHLSDNAMIATFKSSSNYQVEFLTTHRGSDEFTGRLSPLRSLGPHMGGVPLRYLDFLVRHPVRSMILYDTGIPVTVPAPERFAIHKLIVAASRGNGNPKVLKDLAQASELINAHAQNGSIDRIKSAWFEAWERGDSWRNRLTTAALRLHRDTRRHLLGRKQA